jgi:hypothetical protein
MLQVAPMFEINLVQWNIIFDLECISVAESASSLKAFFARRLDVPALLGTLTLERKACKSPFNLTSELFVAHGFNVPRLLGTMRFNYILSINGFSSPESPLPRIRLSRGRHIRSYLRRFLREKKPIFVPSPVD